MIVGKFEKSATGDHRKEQKKNKNKENGNNKIHCISQDSRARWTQKQQQWLHQMKRIVNMDILRKNIFVLPGKGLRRFRGQKRVACKCFASEINLGERNFYARNWGNRYKNGVDDSITSKRGRAAVASATEWREQPPSKVAFSIMHNCCKMVKYHWQHTEQYYSLYHWPPLNFFFKVKQMHTQTNNEFSSIQSNSLPSH